MSAYRCRQCATNWPPTSEFRSCPECGEQVQTAFLGNADPIDVAEAKSRLLHAQFEEWYEAREAKKLADELDQIGRDGA